MRGRLVPLLLAAALAAAAGCGGGDGSETRRVAVADYIRAANTTQQRFAAVYAGADDALRQFGGKGAMGPRTSAELAEAAATMGEVRGSLAGLEPPVEARTLHSQLLRLLDLQISLTRDLSQMARYLPNAARVLRTAEAARAKLQRALERSDTVVAQAGAARAYGNVVDKTLGELRQEMPPAILAVWHKGQMGLLESSARLGDGLAEGLESGNRERIESVLKRFQNAAREAAAVSRAQALAVRAFNTRVKKQRALVRKIVQEQRRLDRLTA